MTSASGAVTNYRYSRTTLPQSERHLQVVHRCTKGWPFRDSRVFVGPDFIVTLALFYEDHLSGTFVLKLTVHNFIAGRSGARPATKNFRPRIDVHQ